MRAKLSRSLKLFIIFGILLLSSTLKYNIYAAGTKNMVATEDLNTGVWTYNQGYRPMTEYMTPVSGSTYRTAGIDRVQKVFAYAKRGEYIYFGTNQYASKLNGGKEIRVTFPNGVVANYDVTKNGVGNINTAAKELNGPNYGGKTDGYNPLAIYIDGENYDEGIYEFEFFSYDGSDDRLNSLLKNTMDSTFTLFGGRVASWDVTVVEEKNNYYSEKKGRVWANYLALSTGGNFTRALYSKLYVLTADGFVYNVDLNGIDPYGFMFFANNRGLIDTSNNTSLYMSVYAQNNQCTSPSYTNIVGETIPVQFNRPNSPDTKYDKSYKVFLEEPAVDLPDYIKPMTYEPGAISDLYFTGINCVDNVGKVGEGGYFHFTVKNATSYEIKLDFTELMVASKNSDGTYILDEDGNKTYERVQAVDRLNKKLYIEKATGNKVSLLNSEYNANPEAYDPVYIDGIVYLRNSCVEGRNSVYWNGRDGKGNYLPKGIYGGDDCELKVEVTAKAGEYHFVLIDVENNVDGTKIEMISDVHNSDGEVLDVSDEERNRVYFNNYNSELTNCANSNKTDSGAENYCTEEYDKTLDGVDTRYQGAASFAGSMGDMSLIDMWSYVTRQSSDETEIATIQEFTLVGIDPEDPDDEPEEHIGTIRGKVFFDNLKDGGSYNEAQGDYLLENYEVKLYVRIYSEAADEYIYRFAGSTRTDANGEYLFENVIPTNEIEDEENWYEVKVLCPVDEAICTTHNDVINNVDVYYDEDDLSRLDVVNDDVGFWWGSNIDVPEDKVGKIEGIVFYDNDKSAGNMDVTQGDYPLEDVEVTLYKKVYDPYAEEYYEAAIDTQRTNSSGYYLFEVVAFNNREGEQYNYYEVRVTSPNEYVICTTENQIISNILVDDNDDDPNTAQIVTNPDVGFWWDTSIDDMPKEFTGSIHGRVYYDADESAGSLNYSQGDYPLEDIKVTLYRMIYNEAFNRYDEEVIETKYTDALGEYHFSNLNRTDKDGDPDNYYEVRVVKPNPYAKCTTRNQVISNIEIILEDEDDLTFDVQNDDVGFFWNFNSVVINKVWAIPESSYPKIKCDIHAYKVLSDEDGNLEYVEVPELLVTDVVLTSTMSWTTTMNLPGRDEEDHYIVYYPTNEKMCVGEDANGNDIWGEPEYAGYDYMVTPNKEDIIPSATKTEHKLINIKRCMKIVKEVDEIVTEDTTFEFKLVDNTDYRVPDRYISLTVPAGTSTAQVVVQDMESGHNYSVYEINIPSDYELDEGNCSLYTTKLDIDTILLNKFNFFDDDTPFCLNFDYDSDKTFTCSFVNTHKKQDIVVTKKVEGNKADTTKDFEWTFNVDSEKGFNAIKTKANGDEEELVLFNNSKFTLKHNEEITIQGVLYGMNYTITETDYTDMGYSTTVNGEVGNQFSGTIERQNVAIDFVNSKNKESNLGVSNENKSLTGMVVIIPAMFVGYKIVTKPKKKKYGRKGAR